jgi:hypothetical protein
MKKNNNIFIWMLALALSSPLNANLSEDGQIKEEKLDQDLLETESLGESVALDDVPDADGDTDFLSESIILDNIPNYDTADAKTETNFNEAKLAVEAPQPAKMPVIAEDIPTLSEAERYRAKEEEKMVRKLLSGDQKARIFIVWSAGFFGSLKSIFIGGSEKEQIAFFQKVRRLLVCAEKVRAETGSLNAKLVFDLVLDETTLKKALPFIEQIESDFPGSLRIEIMEKLLKRIRAAAGKPQQVPENFTHHFSQLSQNPAPLFLDSVNIAERLDLSALSPAHMELLTDIFANALNGNPALSSDVLRILLLNDQAFDWNIYTDIDTFNAYETYESNLEGMLALIDPNAEPQIFFPQDANDMIIGHHLSVTPEAKNVSQAAVTQFLENVNQKKGEPSDLFNVYRDQIKMIKYDYPQDDPNNPEVQSVQRTVDQYLAKIESFANYTYKNEMYNLAEEVIYGTGPGQLDALRSDMEHFVTPLSTKKTPISAQTWLAGKMTRLTGYYKKSEQFIALLLFLDDWETLKKTNDIQFLKTLIRTLQTRWKDAILEGLKMKTHGWKLPNKRLFNSFLSSCIKMQMPKALRKNWDAFANALTDKNQAGDDLYKNFKEQVDWANAIAFDESNENKEDFLKEMIEFIYSNRPTFAESMKEQYVNGSKVENLENLQSLILDDLSGEDQEKWKKIFDALISSSRLPIEYLSDIASFVNLAPVLMEGEKNFDSIADADDMPYHFMVSALEKVKTKDENQVRALEYMQKIRDAEWLDPLKFTEIVTQSAESTPQCPFSKEGLFNASLAGASFQEKLACLRDQIDMKKVSTKWGDDMIRFSHNIEKAIKNLKSVH